MTSHQFSADIKIIGINPYVFVPDTILAEIFKAAGKDKGPIPICGTINDSPYKQTLMKYSGAWRLYINTFMLKNSPKRIGEIVQMTIAYDPSDRSITPHPQLVQALEDNPEAKVVFDGLSPSKKHEIIRYISYLKTPASIEKNISRIISFLLGNTRFAGRDKP